MDTPSSRQPMKASTFAIVITFALAQLPLGGAGASPLSVDEKVRNALQLDQNAKQGAELFARNCAGCHGQQALGSAAKVIPSLAGQRRAYLIKQLADFSEDERHSPEMRV
jgi:cytochrome c553